MKVNKSILLALLSSIGLSACGGSAKDEKSRSNDYIGSWLADGYNYAIHIGKNNNEYTLKQYSYTQDYCLVQREVSGYALDELQQIVRLGKGQVIFEFVEPEQSLSPGVMYAKQEALPSHCTNNLTHLAHEKNYRFDADRDFEIFWQTFNEAYIGFEKVNIDWYDIEQEFRARLQLVQNENDLVVLFSQMIEPLEDGHNIVIQTELAADFDASMRANLVSNAVTVYNYASKPTYVERLMDEYVINNGLELPLSYADVTNAEAYIESQLDMYYSNIFNLATTAVNVAGNDHFIWTTLENNIGYILINQMDGYTDAFLNLAADKAAAQTQIDTALIDLQDTQAIIIDVRLNEGGFDESSLVYVSRFLNQSTHLYTKHPGRIEKHQSSFDVWGDPAGELQYLKPVVVLTSETTFSGAEVFTLAMRERANTMIIGERSGGGLSDILFKRVSANIAFGLSNEVYTSPQGEWFERDGIPVDYLVGMPSKAQRENGIDPMLEMILQLF